MNHKGNCWDSITSESVFHRLKTELVHHEDYQTHEEARRSVFEYIVVFYNQQEKHSGCNHLAPVMYEQ